MARNPLIVQRPQVSLIGGNQLPQASGLGVPIPDIAGPLATLGYGFISDERRKRDKAEAEVERERDKAIAKIERDADANKALAQQQLGIQDADSFILRDDDGNLMPKPGVNQYNTPERNAAFLRALENKYDTAIRNDLSGKLSEIYNLPDIDDNQKLARAQNVLDTIVGALPPDLRQRAIDLGSAEIRELADASSRRTAERQRVAADADAEDRFITYGKEAESAIRGGNTEKSARAIEDTFTAIDDLARSREWPELQTVKLKEKVAAEVKANGFAARLHDHARLGQIRDPDALNALGLALEYGGEAEVKAYVDKMGRAGGFTYRANEIRDLLNDSTKAEELGRDLQEIARIGDATRKENEKRFAAWRAVNRGDLSKPMAPEHLPVLDEAIQKRIDDSGIDDDQVLDYWLDSTLKSGLMPKSLEEYMVRQAELGDYAQVDRIMKRFQVLQEANWGPDMELGKSVLRHFNEQKNRAYLESIQTIFETASSPEEFMRIRNATSKEGAGSPDDTIRKYNDGKESGELTFQQMLQQRFFDTYKSFGTMPIDMENQMKYAFHTYLTMGAGKREEAFDKAWALIEERWEGNRIYLGGGSPGAPLDNPYGYVGGSFTNTGSKAQPAYEWFSEKYKGLLTDLFDHTDMIVMDAKDHADFSRILSELDPWGEELWIEPIGNNKLTPQYTVWWMSETGQRRLLIEQDGRQVPLIIDPHRARGDFESAARVLEFHDETKAGEAAGIEQRTMDDMALEERRKRQQRQLTEPTIGLGAPPRQEIKPDDEHWNPKPESSLEGVDPTITGSIQEWWQVEEANYHDMTTTEPSGDAVNASLFEPRATGAEIAAYAAKAIVNVVPMSDGGQYLLDIAGYESDYGKHPETFRPTGDKGITQINTGSNGAFWGVKHSITANPDGKVAAAAARLKADLGVDVLNASVQDLDRPIYAMAFARLHILSDPRALPADDAPTSRSMKAYLYKDQYNTYAGASPADQDDPDSFLSFTNSDRRKPISAFDAMLVPYDGPGVITDMGGKENPSNFLGMEPQARQMALRLSSAFGQALKLTPHGGKNRRSTGTPNHPAGLAIDIYVGDMSDEEKTRLVATAVKLGYRGLGAYPPGSVGHNTVHFDIRPGKGNGPRGLALWYSGRSWTHAPRWFQNGITHGLQAKTDASV